MTLWLLPLLVTATLETPVTRVVRLLKDMQDRLEADKKADADLYDQLACWCETNSKEKNAAVDAAEAQITSLQGTIEELSAKSAELKSNIEILQGEIAKDSKALAEATALRQKDAGEFSGDEKDLLQSVGAVGDAVNTLSKHHSFLQVASPVRVAVEAALKQKAVLPSQRRILGEFLQQPAGYESYSSRSGEIFGILKQMKETFESNLSQAQKEELQAQKEYAALKAAKNRGIAAAKQQVMDKTASLANADEGLAHAKHDIKLTRDQLSADNKFLLDLKLRCNNGDAEYAKRQKMRAEEIAAVSDCMKILTDDSARDLFSSSLGNNFVQRSLPARARAARVLRATGKPELVQLAAAVQLDAFAKVQASIDEMVVDLKKEMADEVEHRDFCGEELNKNEKSTDERKAHLDDVQTSIADMKSTVDTLEGEVKALNKEVEETTRAIKRASEDRQAENKDFQQTVADQRATQMILDKAQKRLAQTYGGKSLLQQPAEFKAYKKDGGGSGVLQLLKDIIHEAVTLEKEALNAEQDSQSAYEGFVKDSSNSIAAARKAISSKTGDKAELEGQLVEAEGDEKATTTDLEHLATYNGELHSSCDYVLKNFDARQEARGQEIDALGQAKAILSGADFGF